MHSKIYLCFIFFIICVSCGGKWEPYKGDAVIYEDDGNVIYPDLSDEEFQEPEDIKTDDFYDILKDASDDGMVIKDADAKDLDTFVDTGKDETPPKVISAFYTDGKSITVRFSEDIDGKTGGNIENFTIKGIDSSILALKKASVQNEFITLDLDSSAVINPDLTYEVWVYNVTDLKGNVVDPKANHAKVKRTVYMALIWHQHQPFYLDTVKDELSGPWVRKHAVKDYYDMASILEGYPDVHLTINLTAVLLIQLLDYYIERMKDYVDVINNKIDESSFLAKWEGHTDPFIDLLLKDTPSPETATEKELGLFYDDPWSTLSTSDAMMNFFPEYQELRDMNPLSYTQEDFLKLKILFEIAWFDPDFLNGAVTLPDGTVVDLTDVVSKDNAGKYILKVKPSEELANRLVAEEYKIMANVVAIHKKLMYHPSTKKGQIELATTPFYHPILPLITDTDLAKQSQLYDNLPYPAYKQPGDASAHVTKAVKYFSDLFGEPPQGMWPGEGSVAEAVIPMFVDNSIRWIATDQQVLKNSLSSQPSCYQCIPYMIDKDSVQGTGGSTNDEMLIIFRDTGLSNKIGFTFQPLWGNVAAEEFLKDINSMAPSFGGNDRLITVIMDGENAWESYTKEHDGKGFLHALYQSLQDAYEFGEIIPVTVSEYIDGNPERDVPPHPIKDQKEIEPLWAGSWIDGTFSIWIGENEENQAWEYLIKARNALEASGLSRPNPAADPPADKESKEYSTYQAYEEIYAAEGSDWFWWYGADMTSPANDDTPFDRAFRTHLVGMYTAMYKAQGITGEIPDFAPIVQAKPQAPSGPFETPPKIDGLFYPNEGEWTTDGGFFFDNDSNGTIASPTDDIAMVYYGYTKDSFYLALGMNEDMSKKNKSSYNICIYLSQKHITDPDTGTFTEEPANKNNRYGKPLNFLGNGAAWEVYLDFSSNTMKTSLNKADGSENYSPATGNITAGGPVSGGKLIELKIPFSDLKLAYGDPLEISMLAAEGSNVIDNAPYSGSKVIFEDSTSLVYITFEVDVSGKVMDINTYVNIKNPPPPKGKGIVHITGNHDKLQNWIPNKVALRDDGVSPDTKANDSIWTGVFGFTHGTLLRYKYTIGMPTDEGKWTGTEEFPLTERGYDVPKKKDIKKVLIQDIFADRPNPTGTMGPNAKVTKE
jgi:alpha-amylase/alpha-mannosidase (GH57 family)